MFLAFQPFNHAVIQLVSDRHQPGRPLRFPQPQPVPAVHPVHPGPADDGGDFGTGRKVNLMPSLVIMIPRRNRRRRLPAKRGVKQMHPPPGKQRRQIGGQRRRQQRPVADAKIAAGISVAFGSAATANAVKGGIRHQQPPGPGQRLPRTPPRADYANPPAGIRHRAPGAMEAATTGVGGSEGDDRQNRAAAVCKTIDRISIIILNFTGKCPLRIGKFRRDRRCPDLARDNMNAPAPHTLSLSIGMAGDVQSTAVARHPLAVFMVMNMPLSSPEHNRNSLLPVRKATPRPTGWRRPLIAALILTAITLAALTACANEVNRAPPESSARATRPATAVPTGTLPFLASSATRVPTWEPWPPTPTNFFDPEPQFEPGVEVIVVRPTPTPRTPADGLIAVSAGGWRTCGLKTDGSFLCWGDPTGGYDHNRGEPTGLSDFRSISVGSEHTCAVRAGGELYCWGRYGEAGPPGGESDGFSSVSVGEWHICGIKIGGAVECWSTTDYDWNPEAESGQTEPPADAGPFRSISAGGLHTCGVRTDGSVLCWGSDEFGQSTPPEGEFQSISAGGRHTCGIRINGSVRCWGENSDWEDRRDEKHLGATLRPTNTPLVPHKGDGQENRRFVGQGTPPEGAFRAVSAGWRHTCGIRVDGALACWGSPPLAPEQAMPPAGVFISVSVAYGHACAVREDNTVMCWGHRDYQHTDPPGYVAMSSNGVDYLCGEQSDGARVCRARNGAPDLPAPRNFIAIAAGYEHTCGLLDTGAAVCWGNVPASPQGSFTSISDGCFVDAAGRAVCWTNYVQFRKYETRSYEGPFRSAVGDGGWPVGQLTCGLRVDNSVFCWDDDYCRGHDGYPCPPPSPEGTFQSISVAGEHACGVKTGGAIVCWGHWDDDYPVSALAPDGEFQSISIGEFHACAVRADGAVACWGNDDAGQATPPAGEFRSVSVGQNHSCGVKTDGTVACWGSNISTYSFALIPDPNTTYETYRGQATPPEGTFRAVSAGQWHTCGIRTDGSATCWGSDYDAEDGETYYGQATPPGGNR